MEESQELTSEQGQNGEAATKEETPQQEAASAPSTEAQRIAELEAQLAQAKREAVENWNKFLRERADMENFRKRQERMAVDRLQREKRELFQKILGVMDNVERALKYQDTMDSQGLQQALRMLMWQMSEVMRGEGLTPVATVGEAFDPYVHEAIEAVEDTDKPEGTVVEEVLKGYKLGEETLRPARVKVSTGNKQTQ
ncbi:MAG TPA: nucleotide exchange factor GrpE [Ktedonobacteraceae bacterium]|jgi:molecular chaperone GrpE|nr:nucleotide exchange factor GrpE [Ktedonobacteraceae bacterium]